MSRFFLYPTGVPVGIRRLVRRASGWGVPDLSLSRSRLGGIAPSALCRSSEGYRSGLAEASEVPGRSIVAP